MSSRALRKAQKEREKLELEQKPAGTQDGEEEDSDQNDAFSAAPSKPSAFELLGQMQDEGADQDDEDQNEPTAAVPHEQDQDTDDEDDTNISTEPSTTKQQSSSRKKRKKKKKPGKSAAQQSRVEAGDVDDIDAALASAALTDGPAGQSVQGVDSTPANEELEISSHLSIDTHHLQVSNEMKRLFGRAAFEADLEDRAQAQNQANRGQAMQNEGVGLADAVSGRLSKGGPGLPAMLRRRNIFVQGREDWPRQTGNGLSMEIEAKTQTGITTYRFVHTKAYVTCQSIFAQFVAMMDPTNLINLLRYNPYHIGTLLQVSEIAKQQRDHAISGELLERALFAFGKALHPSFAASLSNGKARLDFRRPENREFFLAAWRYIGNIGMRATWRTAYEWARLLLSLDPIEDHYCVHLVIDQLALRAKQANSFIGLARTKFYAAQWADLPNIRYSLALAQRIIDGEISPASERLLSESILTYPWVAARLFQELGIDKIPPTIWGSTPPTDKDKLHSELYVTQGQDLWKPADPKAFLTKISSAIKSNQPDARPPTPDITIDEARFVVLTDKPPLIGLLPRSLTARIDSMSDPLRPEDSLDSYQVHNPAPETATSARSSDGDVNPQDSTAQAQAVLAASPRRFIDELAALQAFFDDLIPDEHRPAVVASTPAADGAPPAPEVQHLVDRAVSRDLSVAEIRARLAALVAFRGVLLEQPGHRVVSDDGAEIVMIDDGIVRTALPDGEDGAAQQLHWTGEGYETDDDEVHVPE